MNTYIYIYNALVGSLNSTGIFLCGGRLLRDDVTRKFAEFLIDLGIDIARTTCRTLTTTGLIVDRIVITAGIPHPPAGDLLVSGDVTTQNGFCTRQNLDAYLALVFLAFVAERYRVNFFIFIGEDAVDVLLLDIIHDDNLLRCIKKRRALFAPA